MSDYHVLHRTRFGGHWKYLVYSHIEVPSGDNDAGVSWVDCILQDEFEAKTSAFPEINQAESDAIAAGTLLEVADYIEIKDNVSEQDALAVLDNAFVTVRADLYDKLSDRYRFWGFGRDVT